MRRGILVLLAIFALSGCDNYIETGLGEVSVIRLGAAWRSEGGGVQKEVKNAGTEYICGPTVNYEAFKVAYTPHTVTLANMPVIMTAMKNQELKFTMSMTYMKNPLKASTLINDFKSSSQEITKIFNESCLKILSTLDMGLDMNIYSESGMETQTEKKKISKLSFDHREDVAKAVMDDFLDNFSRQYGQYRDCFFFIDVAVGNVDFDKKVLTELEKAVAKQYEGEELKYRKQLEDIRGQIRVAQSEADLEAYGTEAGALDQEVLSYMGNDLVDQFVNNKSIDTVLYIPLDSEGNISWFK